MHLLNEMLKEVYDNNFELVHFTRIKEGLEYLNEDIDIMLWI